MIFQFPNLETLRIALTSGQIPPEVSLAAAEVAFDAEGQLTVKPHGIPPKPMQNALKRLGIKAGPAHCGEARTVASWPEIVPVIREPGTPELAPTVPVLFEMPAGMLTALATEMLRLGNDRQSFRCLTNGDAENQRVLLRVIGPPYYTLLRALDHLNSDIAAYVERAPRVWVEVGHTHPLASQLHVPDKQILLLRPPNRWTTMEDGPFHDIYSILDFKLGSAAVEYAEAKLRGKLTVPLRLAPGNAADQPEMWVLRDRALEIFDEFVRDADARLMARLMFAVAENGAAGPTIILRTRPSKLSPPALELEGAVGYVPFRRLNNLFLPAGTRLHPTLRRDAVRKMLADDPAQIVWLTPLDDGKFAPQTLPDEAFLPLEDWINYVIDHDNQALQSWMQANRFDFDSFICKGDGPEAPKPPGPGAKERKGADKLGEEPADEAPLAPALKKGKKKGKGATAEEDFAAPPIPALPDELKIRREELEKEFLAIDGPLEAPERLALWPQLAAVNGGLGYHSEAAICWINGLWERSDLPTEWLWNWLRSEANDVPRQPSGADFDHYLEMTDPTPTDARRFSVLLLWATLQKPISQELIKRLPQVRRYLEAFDRFLGIRAVWLVWLQLGRISGDVLGLARVRDRLVERLLKTGLQKGYDVAQVFYAAGQQDTKRIRSVQEHLLKLRGEVQSWLGAQDKKSTDLLHKTLAPTSCYADLIIAYGLAKTGDERHCKEFKDTALAKLRSGKLATSKGDQVPLLLADAFEFRINEAATGVTPGPLPAEILEAHARIADPGLHYGITRLLNELLILNPHEKSNPYLTYDLQSNSPLNKELAELARVVSPQKLPPKIRQILGSVGKSPNRADLITVLKEAIPKTPRVGEKFAAEIFAHVLPAMVTGWSRSTQNPPEYRDIRLQAEFVAVTAPIAATYGWVDLLQQVLARFVENMRLLDEVNSIEFINNSLGSWLRALRKCGLKDQLQSLLKEMTDLLMTGRTLDQLRREYSKESTRKYWVDMLRSLLHLSEFWNYFGWHAQAAPFIKEAELFLFDNAGKNNNSRPPAMRYVALACSYIRSVGQSSELDYVTSRFGELLKKMDPIPNHQSTTAAYYSSLHLTIVENMVLSLVSDDFILGETARRWLDDDEYLVRRRIHSDMRALLNQSGL